MNSMCRVLLGTGKEWSSLTLKLTDNAFHKKTPLYGKRYHIHCCCSSAIDRTIQLWELTITDHDFLPHFRDIWKRTYCTIKRASLAWNVLSESPDSQQQRRSSLNATQGCWAKFNLWSENLAHFQTRKKSFTPMGQEWGNEDRIAAITQLTCLGWNAGFWECCHWL